MKKRWASGFTITELLIVVGVLAVLAAMTLVAFNGIRQSTFNKVAQSDLQHIAAEMERTKIKEGAYPEHLPNDFVSSPGINVTLIKSGEEPFYTNISPVQNGVLFAGICQQLVNEGLGDGPNQAGEIKHYITGCGNWNHNSMQFTGWQSKLWNTPLTSQQLVGYADNFTTSDEWNKTLESVTKKFYYEIVERFQRQGGSFPINSFWDSWATPQNGGVIAEPLQSDPTARPYYCAEARVTSYSTIIWHISHDGKLVEGEC